MVTIDLRDRSWDGQVRQTWLTRLLGQIASADPGSVIARRVLAGDILAAVLAVLIPESVPGLDNFSVVLLAVTIWPLALLQVGAYNRSRLLTHGVSGSILVTAACWVVVSCVMVGLFVAALDVRQSLRFTMLLLALTLTGRWASARWLARCRARGELSIPILVRGSAKDVRSVMCQMERDRAQPMRVVAVQITDGGPSNDLKAGVLVPRSTDAVDAAIRNGVGAIAIVGPTDIASDDLRRVIWRAETAGIDTVFLPIVEPVAPPRISALAGPGVPALAFQGPNRQMFAVKSALDRVLACMGVLAILPILAGIAVMIRATSSGPILFRQARVGRGGRQFTMLKFRTMYEDAEARRAEVEAMNTHAGGTLFKIPGDPRITPIGHFLRRYSIDELPQLINVLRGEMSLVGPRPPLPEEVAKYPVDSLRRFQVRPGLTGLWQVSGRSDLDPVSSARLDTQYVENWSIGLDLRILARTAKVVVTGAGAY